jgi:hypothetical protein
MQDINRIERLVAEIERQYRGRLKMLKSEADE